MRKNRALKKIIEEETNALLEQDKEFHDMVINDYYSSKEKKTNKKVFSKLAFICAPLLVIVCVLSIVLGGYFGKSTEVPPTEYFEDNEKSITSTIAELNNDLKYTKFAVPENFELSAKLFYDAITNDHLYYYLIISDRIEMRTAEIYIKVNEKLKKDFSIFTSQISKINDVDVKYELSSECDSDGIFTYNVMSNIETALDFYKITYQEMSFEEDSKFLDFVSQTIFKK